MKTKKCKFHLLNGNAVSQIIAIVILIAIVVAVVASIYFYTTRVSKPSNRPNADITWDTDEFNFEITILRAIPEGIVYADSDDKPNLIFTNSTDSFYIYENAGRLELKNINNLEVDKDASTIEIKAGDIITGFIEGNSYSGAWLPTNKALGKVEV